MREAFPVYTVEYNEKPAGKEGEVDEEEEVLAEEEGGRGGVGGEGVMGRGGGRTC